MDFRFPHPAENIGNAVRDVINPDTAADGSLVTQLMNENNRAVEDCFQSISSGTPDIPAETEIRVVEIISDEPYVFDLPTGHLWHVAIRGGWSDVDDGGNGLFCSEIEATSPDGEYHDTSDSRVLARATPGRRVHAWNIVSFGPCTVDGVASPTAGGEPSVGAAVFTASLTATWIRASVATDPS